jgi:hypothetical protein
MTRAVSTVVGFASIVLVALCLDGATQGFFYAIAALTAFLPLADFGVSYAAMQSASHETSGLRWTPLGLEGDEASLTRIGALLDISRRINGIVTTFATALLAIFGTRALLVGGTTPQSLLWAWAGILGCAAMTQIIAPSVAVLEGAGRVREVWRLRFLQETIGGTLLAAALIAGLGVFSLLASGLGRLLCAVVWLRRREVMIPHGDGPKNRQAVAEWRTTVWPFQWRIGVSAVSGFFIFYLFTPVLLVTHGPVVAGQFGMTLAVANGIQGVTTGWLNSQAPYFGALIAVANYSALDSSFARTFRRSTLLALFGFGSAVAVLAIATRQAPAFAARLLPVVPFAVLMTSALVNHVSFALATYLRAHRKEPLVFLSLAGAVLMSIAVPWSAYTGSAIRVAGSYLALNLLGLCVACAVFVSCRRRWHTTGKLDLAIS